LQIIDDSETSCRCSKLLNYTEKNGICLVGSFYCRTLYI